MNGITNFDGFAFNPADVRFRSSGCVGSKIHKSAVRLFRKLHAAYYELVVAKADPGARDGSLSSYLGSFQRNLVTGVEDVPFQTPQKSIRPATGIEWQHDFQIAKPLSLTAGYQFREQMGENLDTLTGADYLTDRDSQQQCGIC